MRDGARSRKVQKEGLRDEDSHSSVKNMCTHVLTIVVIKFHKNFTICYLFLFNPSCRTSISLVTFSLKLVRKAEISNLHVRP